SVKKPINGSRIHLFGIAYKRDVNDMRESPALDIMELLIRRGATVSYTDPWVPSFSHGGHAMDELPFDQAVRANFDCAVIATDHGSFDYSAIAKLPLVVDTRNAIKGETGPNVFKL
ncbi:MAG: UDP binding domain-containing protein, partial [Methylibium sp.]